MISQYINNFKNIAQPGKNIVNELIQTNIHRVFYLSLVSIPARILAIINFLNKPPIGDEKETVWRMGIIISHGIYLVLLLILGGISYNLKKKNESNYMVTSIQYIMVVSMLLFGIVITTIDQLVTCSILPFLTACIAIGIIFFIKPLHSLLIFFIGYIVYYFAVGVTQLESSLLLSNRVNGFTSVIFGLFLSFILWRTNVVNLKQKEHIKHQQKELEEKNKELKYIANYDFLTGLINRRYFEKRMSEEISRMKRYGKESCILILDIDNFKNINDKYGHPVGDEVLKGFAVLLKTQLRETDVIARIGGEEFAILLINTDKETGMVVAEKIRRNTEEKVFIIDNHEIKITVSIGMVLLDSSIDSYEECYKYADRALYSAKVKGKNRTDIVLKS
jgi:diguanylate cyclase (GGDEF)-like protein